VTSWDRVKKRRGVLSPEQVDFKTRRLKVIVRRHRAWLRTEARSELGGGSADLDGDEIDSMFD
jgi:hypothetical protein